MPCLFPISLSPYLPIYHGKFRSPFPQALVTTFQACLRRGVVYWLPYGS